MSSSSRNPFALPGMENAFPDPNFNPLLASMDMMRQAMGGLASAAVSGTDPISTPLTPEDLERRIAELKVVENWLKLNLSMLGSTIQGLEVQSATIKTLRSFVAMGSGAAGAAATGGSPLEVVLGLKPATVASPAPTQAPSAPQSPAPESSGGSPADGDAPAAAQAWWDLLQSQFSQLTAATANASELAQAVGDQAQALAKTVTAPMKAAPIKTTPTKAAPRASSKTKAAARPNAARKAPAKKRSLRSDS